MHLLSVLLVIAVFGFLVWLILQIPMPPIYKNIIIGVTCFILVLYVLQLLGVHTGFPTIQLK